MTGEPLVRRSDDNAEALKKRLSAYHKQTAPLVGYYQKRGLHTRIDATLAPQNVFENIKKVFETAKSKDHVIFLWWRAGLFLGETCCGVGIKSLRTNGSGKKLE